jgi:hypothetical protein
MSIIHVQKENGVKLMDKTEILNFATAVLETSKSLAVFGASSFECVVLANRAVDLVEQVVSEYCGEDCRNIDYEEWDDSNDGKDELDDPNKEEKLWTVWLESCGDRKEQCVEIIDKRQCLVSAEIEKLLNLCPCELLVTNSEDDARGLLGELLEANYWNKDPQSLLDPPREIKVFLWHN